jgi:hypothetical protein
MLRDAAIVGSGPDLGHLGAGRFAGLQTVALTAGNGTIRFAWAIRGVLIGRLQGEVGESLAEDFGTRLSAVLASAPSNSVAYWDLEELVHYDPEIRRAATHAFRLHCETVGHIHVLAVSPYVRMGVAVAGLVLGNVSCTADRAAFEADLEAAVAGRKQAAP